MRKKITALCILLSLFIFSNAQNIPVKTVPTEIFRAVPKSAEGDTSTWHWKRGGAVNVNMSQGTLSNWAAGGDKFSLAISSYFNYHLLNKGPKHTWDNNFDFNFGFLKTTSLGSRKNDDRIDLLSKYGFKNDSAKKWYASALFNFRSQLFDGQNYIGDSGILTSTFLSPAYMLFSAGFDYKPIQNFSLFISPATNRTTIVASKKLYNKGLYGVPPNQHLLNQIGAFASVNYYNNTIIKNVTYRGRIDLFTDYNNNPENVDMFMTHLLTFKVNKFLSATYNLDMIYDDDVRIFGEKLSSPGLQLKSLIGIGFSMPLTPVMN